MNKYLNIFNMYKDGFKNLTLGKVLWKLIFIKLVIILLVLNFFIYDKSINTEFKTENQKVDFVYKNITKE